MFIILLCFLIPLLGAFRMSFVGELSLAEPIVIAIGAFSMRQFLRSSFKNPVVQKIIVLGVLWLLGQIGSDLYRHSPSEAYLRGWFKIVVLLFTFIAFSQVVGTDTRRMIAVATGVMVQPILNYLIYRGDYPVYKFVYGIPISYCAFLFSAQFGRQKLWVVFPPLCAGILALVMNSRALAGVTLSAAMLYALLISGFMRGERSWKRRLVFCGIWAGLSLSTVTLYSTLARRGDLSSEALDKYEEQTKENKNFSLLSGRSEVYFSIPKILQSPIIGWGSWARDIQYVAERAQAMGLNPTEAVASTDGLIPTHSHIFGAWLEAGIFGGLFWIYILYLGARIIASGWLSINLRWCGALSFIIMLFMWDIFFSPFGGERRVSNGFYLWLVVVIAEAASLKRNWQRAMNSAPFRPAIRTTTRALAHTIAR